MENKEIKTESSMQERFDNRFKGYWRGDAIPDEIKFFIQSEIDRAVAKREKEIVESIKNFYIMKGGKIDRLPEPKYKMTNLLNENLETGYSQACRDIINLINHKTMSIPKEIIEEFDKKFDLFATKWTVPPTITGEVLKHIKSFFISKMISEYEEMLEKVDKIIDYKEIADVFIDTIHSKLKAWRELRDNK